MPPQLLEHRLRHRGRAFGRREIGSDEATRLRSHRAGAGARRGHDLHAGVVQALHDRSADASWYRP